MTSFAKIQKAAEKRLGAKELAARLPAVKSPAQLKKEGDDRYLSLMSLRIFRAGLKHEMVDAKWPAFEAAFRGFDPKRVRAMSDEEVENLMKDARFTQLGGSSAPYFLRMAGKDTFVLTPYVVKALNDWGAFTGEPKGKGDRAQVQAQFNDWAAETGLPLAHLSMTLAASVE